MMLTLCPYVIRQFASDLYLTSLSPSGYQALPPLFALGYHQCRWNYNDEADVKAVDAGFDQHDIPYDVIWLDIEHTDGKRYFTWDPEHFPEPAELQHHLQRKKRKVTVRMHRVFTASYVTNLGYLSCFILFVSTFQLVVISDPHFKFDPGWLLYNEAREGGHFVRDREGQIYLGSCWPGNVFI